LDGPPRLHGVRRKFDLVQGTLIICTDSLTAAEEETLRSILLDQYGIHPTRVSNGYKDQYRIRIAKASVATFQVLGLVSEPSPSPEHLPHSSTLNAIPCWPLKPLLFLLIQYFVLFLNPAAGALTQRVGRPPR